MAAAAALSGLRQDREKRQQANYQQLVREQWLAQPDRHPHRAAHYGTFAFKPRSVLAAYEPGIESYAGRIQFLEAHRQNGANFAEAGTLSAASRLGELSPGFLVEAVLALMIVIIGHGVMAAEIESGRVRLLRAQLGQRSKVLWSAKALGLWIGISPFVVVAAVLPMLLAFSDEQAVLSRVGLLLGCIFGYSVLWVLLVTAISALSRTTQQALALGMCLWLASSVIFPRVASGVAAAWHPLPDKSEFNARLAEELGKLGDSHNANDPAFVTLKEETLRKYGVSRVEDLPFNYKGLVMAEGEEQSARVFAQELAKIEDVQSSQAAFLEVAAWLSPALALREITSRLCGTDAAGQRRFIREAEAYRFSLIQQLNHMQRDHTAYAGKNVQRISSDHFDEIADFQPTPPSLSTALAGSVGNWSALCMWGLLAITLGRRAAR